MGHISLGRWRGTEGSFLERLEIGTNCTPLSSEEDDFTLKARNSQRVTIRWR